MKKISTTILTVGFSVLGLPIQGQASEKKVTITFENATKYGIDSNKVIEILRQKTAKPLSAIEVLLNEEERILNISDFNGVTIVVPIDQVSVPQPNAKE